MNEEKAHWINVTGRIKGQIFKCSKCGNTCYNNAYRHGKSFNDYKFCPRCGKPVDTEHPTIMRTPNYEDREEELWKRLQGK